LVRGLAARVRSLGEPMNLSFDPTDGELRVVLGQVNLLVGDVLGNAGKVEAWARQARDDLHGDVIVFPELTLTGYPPEDLLLRPAIIRRCEEVLRGVARAIRGITVVVGYPEWGPEGLHNSAAVIQEGEIVAVYRKQYLPNYSVFDEKRYFVSGADPCVVSIRGIPVGITICEDVWFPGPVRQSVDAGAALLLNINASPYHRGRVTEREQNLRARVQEGSVPIVYVNLIGGQDELVFDGGSFVMDAQGNVTQRAPLFRELIQVARFEYREGRVRPISGQMPDLPSQDEKLYEALVLGVRDYIEKNGFPGAVLGLSGGIDSALTLAVAVDAIGAERVEAVMLPSRYTAPMSLEDAEREARVLGVDYRVIPIEPAFLAFLEILAGEFAGRAPDQTEENIQARCRGIVLMAISNKKGKIVLTTGNKSEVAVGYATLYGDMAGGFAPLKDVPKLWVYRLARYRNSISPVIPDRVLERAPSAELAPDQQDEDSLPAYSVLDPILEMYVEQDLSIDDIVAAGCDPETVRRVVAMVRRNEYKRRQAPPGVRITRRAFGRDRRYPITSGDT
jgi:NAD+ synthase (glutamine-hydrolysing)